MTTKDNISIKIQRGVLIKISTLAKKRKYKSLQRTSWLSDCISRRKRPCVINAKRLEDVTGLQWHKWIDGSREFLVAYLNKKFGAK